MAVLEREISRWSSMPYGRLVSELGQVLGYEVESDEKRYQVEVEMIETTSEYVHVMVAVDDGTLPASLSPATRSFIRRKDESCGRDG